MLYLHHNTENWIIANFRCQDTATSLGTHFNFHTCVVRTYRTENTFTVPSSACIHLERNDLAFSISWQLTVAGYRSGEVYISPMAYGNFEHFNIEFHWSRCELNVNSFNSRKINFRSFYQQPLPAVGCHLRIAMQRQRQRHLHQLRAPSNSESKLPIKVSGAAIFVTNASHATIKSFLPIYLIFRSSSMRMASVFDFFACFRHEKCWTRN